MNILLMISKNDRYGAQRVFLDQVAALSRLGHRIVVVGRGNTGYVAETVRSMGIEYHGISLKGIRDLTFLVRLVKKNKINIIHTYLDRADYFGILLSWLTRKPVISTMNVRRYHIGYKLVDKVVVVSNKQKELLASKGVKKSAIHLIRPGIEVDRFTRPDPAKRQVWKQRLTIEQYTLVLCHISSMLRQKSHDVSLRLIAEFKRRGETPLLIIAGDPLHGEYYDSLLKQISGLGIDQNVYFTGWTSELPELLSLSHFTLLPSIHEAFGMVLVEGMAAGTPIVAREGEGGAELIDEYGTGFLYRPSVGVPELARNILSLWREPSHYEKMSITCRTTVKKNFTLENFGNRLVTLYRSLPAKTLNAGKSGIAES